jgi:tetratricopeptide (TPR) repeat protein
MTTIRLRTLAAVVAFGAALPAVVADDSPKETALKLNDLKDSEAAKAKVVELLKDKEAARKLVREAAAMHKEAADEKPFKYRAALVLAQVSHAVKEYDAAELFYETAADAATKAKNSDDALEAYDGLLALYWERREYGTVEELARRMLDQPGRAFQRAQPFILERLIQAKARQGDTDDALRMAEGLLQLDKGGWYFLQLKGWVQREAGKIDEAIITYEDVLDRLDDAKMEADVKAGMKRQYRYMLSGLHVDNKSIDKAARQLQILIKDDPDNPTYYNDLGYIWADNDKNIEESEKLIRKALELDEKQRQKILDDPEKKKELTPDEIRRLKKENAAYLDSLGWVLFKQGKYEEAVKYLEKAAKDEDDGRHIEIWDHWADALVALGRKKEAVEVWRKALTFEDISPRDKERRKVVTQKMNKVMDELDK